MRKSRFASVCLYVSLITLVINILLIIVMFITSYNARFISRIYQPLVYLHIAIFIASIVSIIRVAASKTIKGNGKINCRNGIINSNDSGGVCTRSVCRTCNFFRGCAY